MRLSAGFYGALVLLAVGVPGEARAACCVSYTPVHVYVPPPHVVVIPHTTYVPHTTSVRPGTTRVNTKASTTPQTVRPKPHPHAVQTVVVDNQGAPTGTRCKRPQGGEGCKKKDDEQTGWATLRRWLQIGKQ